MRSASTSTTVPAFVDTTTSPESTAARYSRPVPTSGACRTSSGTAWRCMFAPISARFASSCSRNGMSAVETETICAGATSMNSTSFGAAAEHLAAEELAVLVGLRGRLRDRVARLLDGVEIDDLVRHFAADDLAVRRLDEAELADRRVRREVADQADVRAFRRLDRAHAAVVGRVHVAHLDRGAFP